MPLVANTSGKSEPQKYVLGRGRGYITTLTAGKLPGLDGWRFFGNLKDMSLNVTEETIKHMSTQSGLKKVDREASISIDISGTFTAEEFNTANLADFLRGTVATHTNPAIAGYAAAVLTTSLVKGRWYDLIEVTTLERAYDVDAADLTVRRDPAGTPATLVQGIEGVGDYWLDTKMGRIFFWEASVTGALVAGDTIDAAVAADAQASVVTEVKAVVASDVDCAFKFIQENANEANAEVEWQFHLVKLKASGDLALIGEDWAGMTFAFAAEENSTLGGTDSPTLTIRSHPLA